MDVFTYQRPTPSPQRTYRLSEEERAYRRAMYARRREQIRAQQRTYRSKK